VRGLLVVGVLGLASCDRVFGLDERDPAVVVDAAPPDAEEPPTDGGVGPGCWGTVPNPPLPTPPDEDADTKPDYCDNCPALPNLDQRDEDRDGIGDVCDPHPLAAVERLAYFDAFNKSAPGTAFGGTWAWNGVSGMIQTNGTVGALYMLTTRTFRRPTVDIWSNAATPPASLNQWQLGGMLINDPAAVMNQRPDAYRCTEEVNRNSTDRVLLDRMLDDMAALTGAELIAGGGQTPLARISYELPGNAEICVIDRGTVKMTSKLDRVPGDAERVGIGLYTRQSGLTFLSVTVYETVWPEE